MWRRLRGGQRKRRAGTTGKASTPTPSSAGGISMAMGVPISTPPSVRSDLEDAATATDNLTEAVVAQEPSPVQLQLPPTDPDREEMNRRLSLDGELPASARRPDQTESSTGTSAGVVSVAHQHLAYRIDVAGCSKAGWEPARAPPGGAPLEQLEVRKENQDAFCIFAPFVGARSLSSSPPPPPEMDVGDIACHNLNSTGANTTTAAHQDCKDSQMFLGVFDGHGAEGKAIAHFVRDGVARMTRETAARTGAEGPPPHAGNGGTSVSRETHRARMETLKSAFSRAERGLTDENNKIDHLFSGTTAVVTWLFNNDVYTAWAGDSRCIVGRAVETDDGRTKFKPVDLSHDQKPNRVDEKKRVKNAGGRIARWKRNIGPLRVWLPRDWIPGLAMTRSIGDTVLSEYGVSPVPEVTYTRLCNSDTFMVLASDGVWEFMTSENVADFVGRMLAEGSTAAETSEALVREAVRRWRRNEMVVDDTTAVVMHFHPRQGAGMAHADAPCARGETLQDAMPSRKDHSSGMEKANIGKKLFGMGRTPFPKRTAWNGTVLLVNDDGRLTDFVCKNDVANGA